MKRSLACAAGCLLVALGLRAAGPDRPTVRDRLWAWAHEAGVYNGHWGLPGPSRITPVEGTLYLGLSNVILIRHQGRPAPPFDRFMIPLRPMHRVLWSITGANGATSESEREQVLDLARRNPNITGVFMDDFFDLGTEASGPAQWLARNNPAFPVTLTLRLPRAVKLSRVELQQTDWKTGDYRTADFRVEVADQAGAWRHAATGRLPNDAGAVTSVGVESPPTATVRVSILGSQDRGAAAAHSCGLQRIRLFDGETEVPLSGVVAEASSSFPGHEPAWLLPDAPAALSTRDLEAIRGRLQLPDRRLDLGVTLYTHQLTPRIRRHLDLCDVISLWTWKSGDLDRLEENLGRLERLAPGKRLWLGCYLYDFGNNRAMPLDRMQAQCSLGLRWLQQGRIEGIIFLATNLCDLDLEAVEWTRGWIAKVGDTSLVPRP